MLTPNMSEANDTLCNFRFQWEDLPHNRKRLSKHFGKPGMDNSRVVRAALFKRHKNIVD